MKATMQTLTKKAIINSVFSNTENDHLFIEVATDLGFAKYFTNLKPLDKMTNKEIDICFDITTKVDFNIMLHKSKIMSK